MVFTVDMPEPVRRSPGKLWRQIRDVLETLVKNAIKMFYAYQLLNLT